MKNIFVIAVCVSLFGCEAVAVLFHGEKPEGPPSYTVRYEANGANGAAPAARTVTTGTVLSLPSNGGLNSAGNIFTGWSESSTGIGLTYFIGDSLTVTQDMVFYAQWINDTAVRYAVTFNPNGATGGTPPILPPVFDGMAVTFPGPGTLVAAGRTFAGWNTEAGGTGTHYNAGSFHTVTGNITLYATWSATASVPYTVAFHSGGGSNVPAQTVISGFAASRPADPIRSGYVFDNWYGNAGLTAVYNFSAPVTGNITLYAKWNAVAAGTYTVTFNSNGGSGVAAQTVSSGGTASRPADPARSGYTFVDWYGDSGLNTVYNFAVPVTGNITLYAKWNAEETPTGLPVEMVWVPGGSFEMGDTAGSGYRDETPVHTVTLTGFYLGTYEITQAQWRTVMGTTIQELQAATESDSTNYGRGDNYPVYYVSWYDALVFCNKLSMAEGLTPAYQINNSTDPAAWGSVPTSSNSTWNAVAIVSGSTGYRLPTEAQREYAAKGGNGSPGNYTYAGSNNPDDVAWYTENNTDSNFGSKPVGTKAPNGLGLYDMSGNGFEWCWDWYGDYSSAAQTDPQGASPGDFRVMRGGGWANSAENVRSAFRSGNYPNTRIYGIGFRLVRSSGETVPSEPTNVTSGADSGPGTLRYAIENAADGSTIVINSSVGTIALTGRLEITGKNITIEGNGVTITRDPSWTTVDSDSQLMYIRGSTTTVNISRVHFKDGRASSTGAAIRNLQGNLSMESCIFSGNQTNSDGANGGAIYTIDNGTMTIKGCTFYGNSSGYWGGAIFNYSSTLTLVGNLFYGNTAASAGPVVYKYSGTVTSNGYNVVDVPFGTGGNQAGWPAVVGDKRITDIPFSTTSFRLLSGSGAANVITTRPANYHTVDFYGNPIPASGAAAGAVQSTASGSGYLLDLTVNDASRGTVNTSPVSNADGLFSGTVTLTASANTGYEFSYWLVDEEQSVSANPLTLTMNKHTKVQAVFGRVVIVNNFNDDMYSETTAGTLRNALANAQDWDIIRFSGVTAGSSTVALHDVLPTIGKSITIEGNGIILSRGIAWTLPYDSSILSSLLSSYSRTVIISRIHFMDNGTYPVSSMIRNYDGTLILENCIFSGNQNTNYHGGPIYNQRGNLIVKGCTFYGNIGFWSSTILSEYDSSSLTLIGNLFYENSASPTINNASIVNKTSGAVFFSGYNVVDLPFGTERYQAGWEAATGDTTCADLGITGAPINTTTFAPVSGLGSVIPNPPPQGFPATDFYGNTRTFPGAPGAVK